jgi:hypothetical protein
MEQYFLNLACKHYNRAFIKNKKNEEAFVKYMKCWFNDMEQVLIYHEINIIQLKTKIYELFRNNSI